MSSYRAVFFDWRGTLVPFPDQRQIVAKALSAMGRSSDASAIDQILAEVREASKDPEVVQAQSSIDTSEELHRSVTMRMYEMAGIDRDLAVVLYEEEWDPRNHPLYPDVVDTLASIKRRGMKIAIISDIHFDIRQDCIDHGIDAFIDAYALSVHLGVQKPDPKVFEHALNALGVEASDALMVGDWPETDGGAAALGIVTLILPPAPENAAHLDPVLWLLS